MWQVLERAATGLRSGFVQARSELRSEVDIAASRLGARIAGAATRAAAWFIAALLLAVAIGFATFACYRLLLRHFPVEEAAAMIAAVFAALALFAALAALSIGSTRASRAGGQSVAAAQASAPSSAPSPGSASDEASGAADAASPGLDLDHVADLLGKVGLTHEQAALLIAKDVAESLTPTQLVAAGLAAGFIFGRKLDQSRQSSKRED
ncbi:hypothetical protein SAMN05519103_00895 [Rhizobiales bacterium GAS113]|nr:hypothetical protein SAMN05519103_00895 [Rhizobiales bacterium GAS113]